MDEENMNREKGHVRQEKSMSRHTERMIRAYVFTFRMHF